jgi:predicted dehydrogenase
MSQGIGGELSRRKFLTGSMAGLIAAGLPEWYAKEAHAEMRERAAGRDKKYGPNDQINLAVIGPGGSKGGFRQGLGDTQRIAYHHGVKVVAACDLDKQHLNEAADTLGPNCAKFDDFRELLARKDIDAVVIGTPDHWHATIAAAALRAGKDVYCEKPLTLTLDEGKRLVKVARSTNRIFQVGSQQRSDARFRMACELVRNGRLGKLKTVHANLPGGPVGGPFEVKPVPSDFNWDMWQGPTPAVDYIPERTHGTFRHWLEYSGGMMTDWGAHHNDIAQWGIGADHAGPIAAQAVGVRHFGYNCFNAFQEFEVTYTYPNDVTLITSNKGDNGVLFEGENGWIFVSRSEIKASDQKLLDEPLPSSATRLYVSDDHHGNFVDCIRSRKLPICDVEIGYRSVSVCHIGNICLRLGGRKLEWDPQAEMFKDDKEANTYLSRPTRNGWHVS